MSERIVNRSPEEEIHRAFQLFDDDNTGKISLRNLKRVARELGENMDDDDLQAMIDEFDLDEDGESMCYKYLSYYCLVITFLLSHFNSRFLVSVPFPSFLFY